MRFAVRYYWGDILSEDNPRRKPDERYPQNRCVHIRRKVVCPKGHWLHNLYRKANKPCDKHDTTCTICPRTPDRFFKAWGAYAMTNNYYRTKERGDVEKENPCTVCKEQARSKKRQRSEEEDEQTEEANEQDVEEDEEDVEEDEEDKKRLGDEPDRKRRR